MVDSSDSGWSVSDRSIAQQQESDVLGAVIIGYRRTNILCEDTFTVDIYSSPTEISYYIDTATTSLYILRIFNKSD